MAVDRRSQYAPKHGKWIRPEKRLAIYIRDNFTCVYCMADLRLRKKADVTLDHIICREKGGDNSATNLVTACKSCNCSRQSKSVEDFMPSALARVMQWRLAPINVALAKGLIEDDSQED